jgi:hypothetical protein
MSNGEKEFVYEEERNGRYIGPITVCFASLLDVVFS